MQLHSGIVVAVPIDSKDEIDNAHIGKAIQEALEEANDKKLSGRGSYSCIVIRFVGLILFADITPFLLERVNTLTKGDSLRASIIILRNIREIFYTVRHRTSEEKRCSRIPNRRRGCENEYLVEKKSWKK